MSKFLVWVAVFFIVYFCGCSNPNSPNTSAPNSQERDPLITGTWVWSNDTMVFRDNGTCRIRSIEGTWFTYFETIYYKTVDGYTRKIDYTIGTYTDRTDFCSIWASVYSCHNYKKGSN